MTITQETANLIDTLASAASKIGSTEASRQLNAKIVDILGGDQEGIVEALREDLASLEREISTQCIRLTLAEIQSGLSRVKWAEGLIKQLPEDHEGRNSWLLNYGEQKDQDDDLPF